MFKLFRRLFRRDEVPEPGSLVEELWLAELSGLPKGRFLEAGEAGYAAAYRGGALELELSSPDLFAWTEAPLYRHRDFVLEGEFEFVPGSPYSACGFLFRYQDSGNFYSALVSNKGFFRLDVVFNGSPRSLVAWTECPAPFAAAPSADATSSSTGGLKNTVEGRSFSLRIIARGGHFTLIIDETWAAEAADDSFRTGHLAFAGQNYGELSMTAFRLRSCFVESRAVEVETWYYRWNYYILPVPAARRRLAETLFAMGEYLAAAVQIRKIEHRRSLDADELFLKAEVALRLELPDEAEEALNACLAADPQKQEAAEEKANLLYLRGRYGELRDWLARLLPSLPDNARLTGLQGHTRFALGDFTGAAHEYRRAADMDTQQPLFRMNEARAWDQAGRRSEAAEAYLKAARLFFDQEADDDLALALHRLAALSPRRAELKELKAKTLFRQGKKEEAGKLLAELVAQGSRDSAVHYLLGILLAAKGEREKALERFAAAVELESDYPLYAFRYAETLFLLGRDARAAVARAVELGPGEGWTLNLAGQEALARGDQSEARRFLEAAHSRLPGASEPAINLAEIESREGRIEAALAALEPFPEDAACRNQAGNILAQAYRGARREAAPEESPLAGREENLAAAAKEYERACALDPGRAEYQTNLAAVYLELERYSDAELRIRRALDLGNDPQTYLLAGNLGLVYGDRARAEASFRTGLEQSPDDPALLFALGRCQLAGRNARKAEETRRRLAAADPERAARLAEEIEEATTEALSCASCGRLWRVPRDLPAQSGASIRDMPPDDSPAGACPRCGKIYCIACRKEALADSRFTCPDCDEALKLSDNRLRWLVREHLKRAD